MTQGPLDLNDREFADDQRERANRFVSDAVADAVRDGVFGQALATACLRMAAQLDGLDCSTHNLDEAEMMAMRGGMYEQTLVATVAAELAKRHALAALPPAGQA